MKRRLTRLNPIYTDQLFYFLTFCTHDRRKLLSNAAIHEAFTTFATAARERSVLVGRYIIMPDHIHLFVAFDENASLSDWVKSLKNSLSKTLRESKVGPPYWQKGFFDHLLRNEEAYGSKWEYVFQNPVRHSLVPDPVQWPYQGEINSLPFH